MFSKSRSSFGYKSKSTISKYWKPNTNNILCPLRVCCVSILSGVWLRHFRNCSVERHLHMSAVSLTRVIHSYQSHDNQFRDTMLPKSRKMHVSPFLSGCYFVSCKAGARLYTRPEGLGGLTTPLLMSGSEIKPGRAPWKGIEPLLSQVGIKPHNEFQSLRLLLLFSIQLFHHTQVHLSNTIPSEFEWKC